MDIVGTQFSLTLGSWRLNFSFAIEETEERLPPAPPKTPHRLYVSQSEGRRAHRS